MNKLKLSIALLGLVGSAVLAGCSGGESTADQAPKNAPPANDAQMQKNANAPAQPSAD